ncbi:hypothetical protein EK21DRAFT_95630 [Setomelanomma holmii]|uniref:Uncharacterized protein n=1 Tax=Setomelanomma holmii TaxID=210430 RepID=A0A9P4GVH9_9PLEO|nr:hypothetical protein EK21DRAFT_95630 [Setomelanomma holmii]
MRTGTSSSAELIEAINSIYLWHRRSAVCYVFLPDLPVDAELEDALGKSLWLTRRWTLQELLAPKRMLFFDANWINRGTKHSIATHISVITRIDSLPLQDRVTLTEFSVAQKMSWAAPRHTTCIEDIAYCLFGIFDLNLPLLYGEGKKAFRRLQQEIICIALDLSSFAWQLLPLDSDDLPMSVCEYRYMFDPETEHSVLSDVLAESPAEFFLYQSLAGGSQGLHLYQVGHQLNLRKEPRFPLRYDEATRILKVEPEERHLLLKLPKQSGYEDFRLGQEERILSHVRSHVLRINPPAYTTVVDPWPSINFDHQDYVFCVSPTSRHDFCCFKLFTMFLIWKEDGSLENFSFVAWFYAIEWTGVRPLFSVVADNAATKSAFERFLSMASSADYHSGQLRALLETCLIPQGGSAVCPIANTDSVATVTIHHLGNKFLQGSQHET